MQFFLRKIVLIAYGCVEMGPALVSNLEGAPPQIFGSPQTEYASTGSVLLGSRLKKRRGRKVNEREAPAKV